MPPQGKFYLLFDDSTVDREIFTVKKFRRLLQWRKLNAQRILSHYTYNVNRSQVAKIKHAKI